MNIKVLGVKCNTITNYRNYINMEAYIITVVTTNHMEPMHYDGYETKSLRGIYTDKETKDKVVKELKDIISAVEKENQFFHSISQRIEEETITLNQLL
jgi:hypothetical protein